MCKTPKLYPSGTCGNHILFKYLTVSATFVLILVFYIIIIIISYLAGRAAYMTVELSNNDDVTRGVTKGS